MNDYHVGTYYLFNLDRGLCDFSTGAASLLITRELFFSSTAEIERRLAYSSIDPVVETEI